MDIKRFFTEYGEHVPGYDVTVVNEREARAAAGILFMLGMIVIFVAIGFNHVIVARVYLSFMFLDFTIRMFTPKYSPSLLLGKFVVQNQKPEYVGGLQKRFAWTLGWLIAIPMMDWFVLHWEITFYKVLVCILCLTLMFLEAAFSICVGCKIYEWITRKDAQHCPGGVCEMRVKEPIQRFNATQKAIFVVTVTALVTGIYLFLAKTDSRTFFGEFLHELVLTDQQLKHEEALKFELEAADFDNDEDF